MLSPSDRNTYRIASLVMRTHAVPRLVSANGRIASAAAIMNKPTRAAAGWRRSASMSVMACMEWLLGAVAHALAEQTGRPEYQHRDQHEEREHVLVIAAEQGEVRVALAALGDRDRNAGELAQVREVADVARAERLDHAEQQAAEHGAAQVADSAEHGGREGLQPEQESHLVLRDAVIGADHHAGDGGERGADDERERDHAVDVDAH